MSTYYPHPIRHKEVSTKTINIDEIRVSKIQLIDLQDEFMHWLLTEGIAPESLRNHIFQFQEFCRFCEAWGVILSGLRIQVCRDYFLWLSQRPNHHTGATLSPGTRAKHYNTLVRLDGFLLEQNLLAESMMNGIRRPKGRKTVIYGFSADQLQALMHAVRQTRAKERYKDRMTLIIYTLASTGLRISEILKMSVNDMDHNRRVIVVLGKGDKEREVPFSRSLSRMVKQYIEKYGLTKDNFIFASRYGKPLASSSIRDALRKAKKQLGSAYDMDRMRVSPHTLRHTFAKLWVTKGGNTIALSRILGHSSIITTDKYVQLWGIDLGESYDMCNPCGGIEVPEI